MTVTMFFVVGSCAAFVAGVALLRAADARALRSDVVTLELRFNRRLDEVAIQDFLGAVTGLLPPWWRRWFHTPFVMLEVHAAHDGIRHRLVVPKPFVRTVESALAAHMPGVRYSEVENPTRPAVRSAVEYRINTPHRALAVEPAAISKQLLASLQPLSEGVGVVLQVALAAAAPVQPARVATKGEHSRRFNSDGGVMPSAEAVTALKKKQAQPLLLASLRIGVDASSRSHARSILRRVEAAWHVTRAPGVHLRRRHVLGAIVARRLIELRVPLGGWMIRLNAQEASGLVGFPIEAQHLSGVSLGASRLLPVPDAVGRFGSIIGDGVHPRTRRPVAIDEGGRRHHLLGIGATGAGKSVLATHLAVGDAERPGTALIVFDPKDGSLLESIIESLPEHRLESVLMLDPTDSRPVGFDPLACTPATINLVVDRVLGLMVDIWGDNLGPRSSDILRHVLLTIASTPGLRLTEAPALLVDPVFRRRVVAQSTRREVIGWWRWAESLSASEWNNMTMAPLNKLRAMVGREVFAHTVGQQCPAVAFDRVLDEGQILLIRLPVGLLGAETTALLGAMLISQLFNAVAARAGIAAEHRRPASVIIDEVATVLRFPASSIEMLLTQARGYNVAITLLGQNLAQLPPGLRQCALVNCRTLVAWGSGREDAAVFAREFGSGLTAEDLMDAEPWEVIAAVYAHGKTQPPATVKTRPPGEPLRDGQLVAEMSRQRWGVDRDDIDAAMDARVEAPANDPNVPPIGRKRRQP